MVIDVTANNAGSLEKIVDYLLKYDLTKYKFNVYYSENEKQYFVTRVFGKKPIWVRELLIGSIGGELSDKYDKDQLVHIILNMRGL
jgi:hypothetical protein